MGIRVRDQQNLNAYTYHIIIGCNLMVVPCAASAQYLEVGTDFVVVDIRPGDGAHVDHVPDKDYHEHGQVQSEY